MITARAAEYARRQFLAADGMTFATACIAPGRRVAEEDRLVENAFKEAATANGTVQTLDRNISVLWGAGGNLAFLTGSDGKLLVDA